MNPLSPTRVSLSHTHTRTRNSVRVLLFASLICTPRRDTNHRHTSQPPYIQTKTPWPNITPYTDRHPANTPYRHQTLDSAQRAYTYTSPPWHRHTHTHIDMHTDIHTDIHTCVHTRRRVIYPGGLSTLGGKKCQNLGEHHALTLCNMMPIRTAKTPAMLVC